MHGFYLLVFAEAICDCRRSLHSIAVRRDTGLVDACPTQPPALSGGRLFALWELRRFRRTTLSLGTRQVLHVVLRLELAHEALAELTVLGQHPRQQRVGPIWKHCSGDKLFHILSVCRQVHEDLVPVLEVFL